MSVKSPFAASAVTALAAFLISAAPLGAQTASATKAAAKPAASAEPGDAAAPGYDTFVKDAERKDGLFPVIIKGGKVYLELTQDQLDKDFYEHATTANGLGGFGLLSGDDFQQDARIVRFHRIDDKHVAVVWPHEIFVADANTPLQTAIDASTADSVEGVANVSAEDKTAKKLVIDTAFLLGDQLDLGNYFDAIVENPMNPQGGYHLDSART